MEHAAARADLARAMLTAAHDIEHAITAALHEIRLGVSHYLVLSHLAQHETAAASELASVALVPPATLTRVIDKLVDRALVYRSLDSADRRRTLVRLTDRGRLLTNEWTGAVNAAIAEALPALREWEVQAFSDMLRQAYASPGSKHS